MSDKKLDWKLMGQCLAVLVRLFSTITEAFKKSNVGPEILDWLDGSGRDFLGRKIDEIAHEFTRRSVRVILRDEIDLDSDPSLPFSGSTIKRHIGGGKMSIIEKCDDGGVYLNGKRLILRRSERQIKHGSIRGRELLLEMEESPVLNATLNDFLARRPEFVPEDWKVLERSSFFYVFFLGTQFLDSSGVVCLRHGHWVNGGWASGANMATDSLGIFYQVALSAS